MPIWIGVDVGGTFTDLVGFDDSTGKVRVYKTPSTPPNPAEGIIRGIGQLLLALASDGQSIAEIAHGTTVGTNALIQRKGGKVALLTTEGFRDLLEIGFQNRFYVYDLHRDMAPPLVPRLRRFEIEERITAGGAVVTPLAEDEIARALAALPPEQIDSFAVCFLFSYLNPEHERLVGAALRARFPEKQVSLSSEVQPEFREYQRFSTTVLNAFLQPVMSDYLASLKAGIDGQYAGARLSISQSNGGLMSGDAARRFPVRTALSGPAAGVTGALEIARHAGRSAVITFDMGGTSTDVAMIQDFAIAQSYGSSIGGYPVRLPMVDVNTVGAGGGSIAWFDRDDLLKVGPLSAGAVPGPACYGLGGSQPTVTDANLLLHRLSPRGLLAGALPLDTGAAARAIRPISERLGMTLEHAALGIIDIVVSNMVRAIRAVSVERGYDARNFTLLPFGGGGPLHARAIAVELGIKEILVPPHPGILCAAGLMSASLTENFVHTVHASLDPDGLRKTATAIEGLMAAAERWFDAEHVGVSKRRREIALDLAYQRQSFEISIPLPPSGDGRPNLPSAEEVRRLFIAAHERAYGYASQTDPIIVTNCRLRALGLRMDKPFRMQSAPSGKTPAPTSERLVWFDRRGPQPTPVLDRDTLAPSAVIRGPAVIEQFDSTTLIFPGDRATIDEDHNLVVEVGA
jgi:N-methylhydantoinase A